MTDYKTGKLISIIKQWLGNNEDKFEINGADLARSVFMYRTKTSSFEPIPKGNYRIISESNNQYIKIDDDIKNKAYEYQVIYDDTLKGSTYDEDFPEVSVLVDKYNTLVKDTKIIEQYLKTVGIKADTNSMSQVLTPLEPNTFWAANNEGIIETLPIGDRNLKYEAMLEKIKNVAEEKTDEVIEKSGEQLETITEEMKKELDNYKTIKANEITELALETLNELNKEKNKLSVYIADYIAVNREQLKGDRGDRGEQGPRGERGERGYQGIKGERGPKGDTGPAGTTDYNNLQNKPDLSKLGGVITEIIYNGSPTTDPVPIPKTTDAYKLLVVVGVERNGGVMSTIISVEQYNGGAIFLIVGPNKNYLEFRLRKNSIHIRHESGFLGIIQVVGLK